MNVDLRRFNYVLDPLRSQRRWKLEALLARLGHAHIAVTEAEAVLSDLRQRHHAICLALSETLVRRLNPTHHREGLRWLADLQGEIREAEVSLQRRRAERSKLQSLCLASQQKVDVLDAHFSDCLVEFSKEESGRSAAEADRDWLIRVQPASRRYTTPGTTEPSFPVIPRLEGGHTCP